MGRKKSFTNRKKQNKRKYEKQSPLPSKATCCTLQQTSTTPGRQRQRGGVNENPTSQEFLKNNNALRMVNSIKIDTHKGNIRGRNNDDIMVVSTEPLKKKRRQSQCM